ncbi:uncharacterized protein LOC117220749 isoform X1 [Megalopta genalis]|uniref:uncharacterized protein LOC117220749 isoform X1 n=1 Tax=Megalopta genalis TaxID=115081 RepID=UPI003FCF3DB1
MILSQIVQQGQAFAEKQNRKIAQTKDANFATASSKSCTGEKLECDGEDAKVYRQNFMAGPSFASAIDSMPPAPPLPPQLMAKLLDNDADALSSMLMSWYISGFHTGRYFVLEFLILRDDSGNFYRLLSRLETS